MKAGTQAFWTLLFAASNAGFGAYRMIEGETVHAAFNLFVALFCALGAILLLTHEDESRGERR